MNENEVDKKLNELSITYKSTNNRPFLNMQNEKTSLDYKKSYLNMIWTLKICEDNGLSDEIKNEFGLKVIFNDDNE